MRKKLAELLLNLMRKDKNVLLLICDTGAIIFDDIAKEFPDNFINFGIAEQNMVGVASGLALCGKIPFIFGITPFILFRAYEQVRNDILLQNANVKIIGSGSKWTYGSLGLTHYSHEDEDINLLSSAPGKIEILKPSSIIWVEYAIEHAYNVKTPVYIRLTSK